MTSRSGTANRLPLRQPRIAELIANDLRSSILSGELSDGDSLPKQEDLAARFGVSQPSIREALFTLESEGLVVVRRGARGGAVVRRPRSDVAAFMSAMVLQSGGTSIDDLAASVALVEPLCAAEAASSADRATLVAHLRQVQQAAEAAVGDGASFTPLARQFHDGIVRGCGLQSLSLVVGVLESLWSAHERRWAARTAGEGRYATDAEMEAVLHAHAKILQAIEDGDRDTAAEISRRHVQATQRRVLEEIRDHTVEASALGPRWTRS
ncbi:FadR/GntR family transcriptional regulator [Euzebya sp.]|uniref:FadR/GntR family transcriptional regulator n=1 Tax=Euzebya sp. TaxID=1971409 RepID=UPI003511D3B4